MKFSTTFTLATLALMSIGTHARIGKDQHRQLETQVEGIGCCKVNDIDNCQVTWTGGCKQIGDTGLSCYHGSFLPGGSCCTPVDQGTYWFLGGCK